MLVELGGNISGVRDSPAVGIMDKFPRNVGSGVKGGIRGQIPILVELGGK